MNYYDESIKLHEENQGKIQIESKVKLDNIHDLSIAYTPGVAGPCLLIKEKVEEAYRYTSKGNMIAVVTDGSAVLGLGNIGATAALPVMEGKALLFKRFGDIDAFPICIESQEIDQIIEIVKNISPGFAGINLEDISAPRCFEIERRLQEVVNIPVFHDDQHGTAIVVAAAVINAAKYTGRKLAEMSAVVNGAGAAGTAIVKMLNDIGITNIVVCDSKGIITKARNDINEEKRILSEITNEYNLQGTLLDAVKGKDLFIGVSTANTLTANMVRDMASDPIIFAMANPEPEIMPSLAIEAGAAVVGTGRSDFNNQINNVLIFPGIFKGALRVRAKRITDNMKLEAAYALASIIEGNDLKSDNIIPSVFNETVAEVVAQAVAKAWEREVDQAGNNQ